MTSTASKTLSLLILLLLGLIWGSGYSLARYATTHGVPPLGYAFWQSLGPAIFLTLLALFQRTPLSLGVSNIRFYFVCGLLGIALPNSNMYFAVQHIPAGLLAVLVNTVPIITYVLAFIFAEERFSWARFAGVLLAIVGIMLIIIPETSLGGAQMTPWVLVTLISPICFALTAIYASKNRPVAASSLTLSAGMLISSTILLTPVVIATHNFYSLMPPYNMADFVVVLEMVLSSIGYVLLFKLLKMAGAVYYSLVGGVVALTGLFWGWLIFNETLNRFTALAVLCILLGILLVTLWQRRSVD